MSEKKYQTIDDVPYEIKPFTLRGLGVFRKSALDYVDSSITVTEITSVTCAKKGSLSVASMPTEIIGMMKDSLTGERIRCDVDKLQLHNGKSVTNCSCRCSSRSCWSYGLCVHGLALLLEYEKTTPLQKMEDETEHRERAYKLLAEQYAREQQENRKKYSTAPIPVGTLPLIKSIKQDGFVIFDLKKLLQGYYTCQEAVEKFQKYLYQDGIYLNNLSYQNAESGIEANGKMCIRIYDRKKPYLDITKDIFFLMNQEEIIWFDDWDKLPALGYDHLTDKAFGRKRSQFLNEFQLVLIDRLWKKMQQDPPPLRTTGQQTRNFLSAFHETALLMEKKENEKYQYTEPDESVRLLPRLVLESDSRALSFRVVQGKGKGYVIKDIQRFTTAVLEKKVYEATRSTEIDFGTASFDPRSARFFSLITDRIENSQEMIRTMKWSDYLPEYSIPNAQPLEGSLIDSFYELAKGSETEIKLFGKESFAMVTDADMIIGMKVEPYRDVRGTFMGVTVNTSAPLLINGASGSSYAITSTMITRIPEEQLNVFRPLSAVIKFGDSVTFHVLLSELNDFYYRVLPTFRKNPNILLTVTGEDEIRKSLNPEPEFSFFADIKKRRGGNYKASVTCTVNYGNEDLPLAEPRDSKDLRDMTYEKATAERVAMILNFPSHAKNVFSGELSEDQFCEFVSNTLTRLEKIGSVESNMDLDAVNVVDTVPVEFSFAADGGLMDISVTSGKYSKKELQAILESYTARKRWYKISDTEFIDLTKAKELAEICELISQLDLLPADIIQEKARIPLFRALYVDRLLQEHDQLQITRDHTYRRIIRNFQSIGEADYAVPESLQKILREYQVYGYKWLQTLAHSGFGGILADDMGLGKTLQTISLLEAAITERRQEGKGCLSMVVAPASLVYQWAEEVMRFSPDIKVFPLTGPVSSRREALENPGDINLFVISYELLSRDIAMMQDMKFDYLIIDEAQKIKNHKAGFTKAVKTLKADVRLALTGTPIENRLSELWSIFDFIMPGFLFSYLDFSRKFESPIRSQDKEAVKKLKAMTSPFILRRRKADVLKDLPSKMEEVVYTRISGEQQKLYDAQVLLMKKVIKASSTSNLADSRIKVLAELMKIRQICCDPALAFEDYKGPSAKKDACMDLIDTVIDGGHRCLVFSQFTSMLELLEEELNARSIPWFKITGATPKETRGRLVREFNEGDVPVFLISLKAGGTGLNLVGADTVIHYDPWWNMAAQNQATDRAHRIGQTKKVTVYRLILKDTIEEKILNLQQIKKDLADAILEGEQQSLMTMTADELLDLLS